MFSIIYIMSSSTRCLLNQGEGSMTKINFVMTVKSKGISVSWLIWSYVSDDKEAQGKSILLRRIIHFWCGSEFNTDGYRLKWEAVYFISSDKCWISNSGSSDLRSRIHAPSPLHYRTIWVQYKDVTYGQPQKKHEWTRMKRK